MRVQYRKIMPRRCTCNYVAKDYTKTIALRIPDGLLDFMDHDIETYRDHRNRSEYIVAALREYESRRAELKRINRTEPVVGDDARPEPGQA